MVILTVTLNPALDLTTDTGKVESGYKLRCGPARLDPGGGGVNVSRAIAKLGGRSTPFVAIGGPTGDMLKSLLEGQGIDAPATELCDAVQTERYFSMILQQQDEPNQSPRNRSGVNDHA